MQTNRRQFLKTSFCGMTVTALAGVAHAREKSMSCQALIDQIVKKMIGKPLSQTVDTIKMGDASQPVRGIVTTMFANCETLEKAAALGANLIIAHEPTFYSHQDETGWLKDDPVFEHKRRLIEKHGLVIWRCHDTIHRMRPDGILAGMEQQLGWSSSRPGFYTISPQSVADLCTFLKARLDAPFVRVVGSLERTCKTVAFFMGAPGGQRQMMEARRNPTDVVIIGECPEWETHEYFRDAQHAHRDQTLIVLGHIPSEQAGMKWLAQWLQAQFPDLSIKYMANTCPWTLA